MSVATPWIFPALLVLVSLPARAAEWDWQGDLTESSPAFSNVDFEVPAGTREIFIKHEVLTPGAIVDFGVWDTQGARGWGGGNTEDIIIGESSASRSYQPGALQPGTWRLILGKAQLTNPSVSVRVHIEFRDVPTLAADDSRRPYEPHAARGGARWYAGDFHVHSTESGDALASLEEIAVYAESRKLDFVVITDHNTLSQKDLLASVQERHPNLLLIPGIEWTTYAGHGNAIGARAYVDHRVGEGDTSVEAAVSAFHAQNAIFSINHPTLDLDGCIGCAWDHGFEVPVDALEVASGGYAQSGFAFFDRNILLWERLQERGLHVTALGGSDDHRAGQVANGTQSPIGTPTTLVWAENLSEAAIIDGVRAGRTAIKLQSPDDPFIDLTAGTQRVGDTVQASKVSLTAHVTGAAGMKLIWIKNGTPQPHVELTSDDEVVTQDALAPETGTDRWRAEIRAATQLSSNEPRSMTGVIYVTAAEAGCGCSYGGSPFSGIAAVGCAALAWLSVQRKRRRQSHGFAAQ